MKQRILWIDWMKVLGMLAIVYGHFKSSYYEFAYVFSVPLFFAISGFLSKIELSNHTFLKKVFWNLIIPMLGISIINYCIEIICNGISLSPISFVVNFLLGMHDALRELWFVYTLIILKGILQYGKNIKLLIACIPIALLIAWALDNYDITLFGKHVLKMHSAILSVFLAYPFFIMGYFLENERKLLAIRKDKIRMGLLMLCSAIGVYLCSQYNDCVWMVNHEFGGNIFYFLIGSICGIVLVYILARMLEDIKWHFIIDLSTGMILILGFQMQFITLICRYIHICGGVETLIASVIVMLIFIPIIKLAERYCPYLMGKYRIN